MAAATPVLIITNNAAATKIRWCPRRRPSGKTSQKQTTDNNNRPDGQRRIQSASTRLVMTDLLAPAPRMETKSRIGITARSCASRTEKLARPAAVARRP